MRPLLAAVLALAALPAAAAAQHHGGGPPMTMVSIGFATYAPPSVAVLAGDTVHWTNDSLRVHTVTAQDGTFDSGRLPTRSDFTRTFAAAGDVAYHCTLHAGMTGRLAVRHVLLDPPATSAAPGRSFPVRGRSDAIAGTPVHLEADDGSGWTPVAETVVGLDQRFAVTFVPRTTVRVRAVVEADTADPVDVLVLDHRISATVRRRGGRVTFNAIATPASPGGTVVVQLRLPERFGWWPVARGKLDAHSRARLTVALRRRVPARVLLTQPDGATVLASTGPLGVPRVAAPHHHH